MQTHDSLVHELVSQGLGLDLKGGCLGGVLAENKKTSDEADYESEKKRDNHCLNIIV
jgi:hypothetical protein